jgi:hypothetical protein
MRAASWCRVALLAAAGCGRIGVHLLPLADAETTQKHMDAGVMGDAGLSTDAGIPADNAGRGGAQSYAMDAMIATPPTDAAMQADAPDANKPSPCSGQSTFGLCWHLASEDTSCNDECANKGGFDSRALGYIGIAAQGGSQVECMQIFQALGQSGSVVVATRQDSGLGCHLWNDGTLYWLQQPAFTPDSAAPRGTRARIVCACLR